MKVTFFFRPSGKSTVVDIPNVNHEDVQYFESNNIKCSMEELTNGTAAIYGKLPWYDKEIEDHPEAIVVVDMDEVPCGEAFSRLVLACEEINNGRN